MDDLDWLQAALSDENMVAEILISLKYSDPSLMRRPLAALEWSVRQPRSKSVFRERSDSLRNSPRTPFFLGGATSNGVAPEAENSSQVGETSELKFKSITPVSTVELDSNGSSTNETTVNQNLAEDEASNTNNERKRKTLAELKEEEDELISQRLDLLMELERSTESVEMKREMLENLKRMRGGTQSEPENESVITPSAASDAEKLKAACGPSSAAPVNAVAQPYLPNDPSHVGAVEMSPFEIELSKSLDD